VVARQAHERHGPSLVLQGLIYPLTDSSFNTPSWKEYGDGPLIAKSQAVLARLMYTPSRADWQDPDAFPLAATDLQGLPPALVITAEIDPLCDEGETYAEALRRAGVPVLLSRYQGMIHGFVQMAGVIDAGRRAIDELAAALQNAFDGAHASR
jgi:acetyl esterase